MRLIDADALPISIWLDGDGNSQKAIKYADLAAAPTVRCEKCRHNDPVDLGTWCLRHEFAIPGDDFGCAYFEISRWNRQIWTTLSLPS